MPLTDITLDDIESLAVGAWVLGTGGGGSPYLGLLNMRALYKQGNRVQLMPASDLADDEWVAAVSNMGAPLVGQERLTDSRTIARAVDLAGAGAVVARVGGLDTMLGGWFEQGQELSGGQWQKLALARAFMRDDAEVLVLDEPTAAVDAQSEADLFAQIKELARHKIAFLISHRFSTVRMADRILVLEGGRIVEAGSHAELLALGEKYATLFALQAKGYH